VLKHEMAHQYTDEVLGALDEAAHGPTFRRVCEERGFDARAWASRKSNAADHHSPILDSLAKLLALAESSNENEARAAMNAAHAPDAESTIWKEQSVGRDRFTELPATWAHRPAACRKRSGSSRLSILSSHFFVDAIWVPVWRAREGKRGSVLEICGRLPNLEMAEYVYAFLLQTAARCGPITRKSSASDRTGIGAPTSRVSSPASSRSSEAQGSARNTSEGLVWVGDAAVGEYFHRRHPRVRWTRHVSSRGSQRSSSTASRRGGASCFTAAYESGASSGPVRQLKGR